MRMPFIDAPIPFSLQRHQLPFRVDWPVNGIGGRLGLRDEDNVKSLFYEANVKSPCARPWSGGLPGPRHGNPAPKYPAREYPRADTRRQRSGRRMPARTVRPLIATARALTAVLTRARATTAVAAAVAACALAACSSPAPSHPAAPATSKAAPAAAKVPSVKATPPPQPKVITTRVRTADGALVTVAVFRSPVRYVLHTGSGDPGPVGVACTPGPAVTGTDRAQAPRARSTAASGFRRRRRVRAGRPRGQPAAAGTGQLGHRPLRSGPDRACGATGCLYVVRRSTACGRTWCRWCAERAAGPRASADWGLWGATLGGGADVARSALGQECRGRPHLRGEHVGAAG